MSVVWAGEKARGLGVLPALPEDLGLIPRTHSEQVTTVYNFCTRGFNTLSLLSPPEAPSHIHIYTHTDTHIQTDTHTHAHPPAHEHKISHIPEKSYKINLFRSVLAAMSHYLMPQIEEGDTGDTVPTI